MNVGSIDKEGLTYYNYIKVAYVVTTDPSCLRMTGSESDTLQALLFSMKEKREMDRSQLYKDSRIPFEIRTN
jgi:hypothetical protein